MAIYACSDLHGKYDLYEQICDFLKPADTVYFLGDACDRGPDGWKLMKAIYDNPQFIYLKGNHEDMFVKAVADIEHHGWYDYNYMLSCSNGGENTIIEWEKDPDRKSWISKINCLPTFKTYVNENDITIYLSHAGFTPRWDSIEDNLIIPEEKDLIWDRKHYRPCVRWDSVNFKDAIIVHGHTPIPLLREDRGGFYTESIDSLGAFWYCGDHKVCIDNGSAWTGAACLFDLNTFDEHMFLDAAASEEIGTDENANL